MESVSTQADCDLSSVQQECIATLCLLPRTWISRSMSATYELRGVAIYEQFTQAIETIKKMDKKQPHALLSRLKEMLENSLEDWESTYSDLKKAQSFLGQLTDNLYGEKHKDPITKQKLRQSVEYRKTHRHTQIKQQLEQLIVNFKNENKTVSTLCRKFIQHFESTLCQLERIFVHLL